jgi:hypothetical protein
MFQFGSIVVSAGDRKRFFFVKKKQKTFFDLGLRWLRRPSPKGTKFFCFFLFTKRSLPASCPLSPALHHK